MAHGEDLRAEVQDNPDADRVADAVKTDYRDAPLSERDRAMLDFAMKLTLTPQKMQQADVEALRAHGFDDSAIHDIVQATALFAYYNRIADGLGIDPE
ncbi:MAG: peroxidase-related enzyme [bacterium]|nr:peroxidase-related enzyme [bacterium]